MRVFASICICIAVVPFEWIRGGVNIHINGING